MKDEEILRLYRERSETALTETERQYGVLCGTIARNILRNRQDAEECVNDTWHRAWNSIPPEEPRSLAAYLGRITRNLALNRLQKQNRLKRGGGEMTLIWEELGEMLPDRDTPEQHWERRAIAAALERFLRGLTPEERILFLRRYWWAEPVKTAAAHSGISPRRARSILERLRRDLRNELSQKQNIPAYLIFTNASLTDMAARQPDTMEEFLQVSGVGEYKAKRYGKVFLDRIAAWKKQHPSD